MPSLEDLTALTSRLDQLAGELHLELAEGSIDFRKMVVLADDLGEHSDRLAAAFTTMADALETALDQSGNDEQPEGDDGEQNT
jgi:hypothetical protein